VTGADEVRRIATATIAAAKEAIGEGDFAVVVIVRQLPHAGMPGAVVSNLQGIDRKVAEALMLSQALNTLRGGA
jgi:hypothetical protein